MDRRKRGIAVTNPDVPGIPIPRARHGRPEDARRRCAYFHDQLKALAPRRSTSWKGRADGGIDELESLALRVRRPKVVHRPPSRLSRGRNVLPTSWLNGGGRELQGADTRAGRDDRAGHGAGRPPAPPLLGARARRGGIGSTNDKVRRPPRTPRMRSSRTSPHAAGAARGALRLRGSARSKPAPRPRHRVEAVLVRREAARW